MTVELTLDQELVFNNLEVGSQAEVLQLLAEKLLAKGYVKPEYVAAIQAREAEYPTGLPSSKPGIAIPHANYELVEKTTLAIATLAQPIAFHNMENNAEELDIQIVIMLAIGEPHGQVEMLQKIVGIIQDEPLRQAMLATTSQEALLNLVKTAIN